MRRGFSILLILFFGLGPLSAFVDGNEDAGLPACCRRHGAHHCAMYAEIVAMRAGRGIDPTPSFSASPTCPLYHGPTLSILIPAHALGQRRRRRGHSSRLLPLQRSSALQRFQLQAMLTPGVVLPSRTPAKNCAEDGGPNRMRRSEVSRVQFAGAEAPTSCCLRIGMTEVMP